MRALLLLALTAFLLPPSPIAAQTLIPARAVFQYHKVIVKTVCYETGRSYEFNYTVAEANVDLSTLIPMQVVCGAARITIPALQVTVADKTPGTHSGAGFFTPSGLLTSYTASVSLYASNPKDPSSIDPINAWSGGTQCKSWGAGVRMGTTALPLKECNPATRINLQWDFAINRWIDFEVSAYFGGYIASGALGDKATNRADMTVYVVTYFKSMLDGETAANPHSPSKPTDSISFGRSTSGCMKRSAGPIKIPVRIQRVVAEVNSNGELSNPDLVRQEGLLWETAKLRLPVFHRNLTGSKYPGIVHVRVNGKEVGERFSKSEIIGQDETWTLSSFDVPSEFLRYGRRIPGQSPQPGENTVELEIDTGSPQIEENWCAASDWAEIKIAALYPLIMVHGNGQGDDAHGGEFWDGLVLGDNDRLQMPFSFTGPFKDRQIQYDNSISMPTDTIAVHGDLLAILIPQKAAEFGVKHVHLVAHSKGGLDSRDFLARTVPRNFGVFSLTTLSTPHRGSAGPDYQIDSIGASVIDSDDSTRTALGQQVPPNKGTPNLRVAFMREFNRQNIPLLPRQFIVDGETNPIQYRSISADMNLDGSATVFGNPTIQHNETAGLPGQKELAVKDTTWAYIVEQVYRLLGNVQSTYTEKHTAAYYDKETHQKLGETTFLVVKEVPTASFQLNDSAVTLESATIAPFDSLTTLKANHSTVAGPPAAYEVINAIHSAQRLRKP